jgi:SAM-dependent methyltransferase
MPRSERADSLLVTKANYEGLAEWYDQEQARVAGRPDAPLEQFAELAEPAGGFMVEIGCGTGLAAAALNARGWQVGGIDLSMDQLGIARERCRWIVQADAHELPVRTASLQTVGLAFVHTDVDAFDGILHEVARVLQPGGRLVCLGIHPCFVGHHVDSPTKSDLRLGIVPGYRDGDWVQSSEQFGPGIRSRVGARHIPLADYLMAFVLAPLQLERVVELGDGIVPWMLGITACRPR